MSFKILRVAGTTAAPTVQQPNASTRSRPYPSLALDVLDRIGIPRKFKNLELATHPCGRHIIEWLKAEGRRSILQDGVSWIFDLRCRDGFSILPLLMRGAHLNGISVRLLRLDEIAAHITHKREKEIEYLRKVNLLGIEDFFDVSRMYKAPPFTPSQLRGVEDLLISRQKHGRSSIMEIYNPNGLTLNHLTWWRESSFARLAPNFLSISSEEVKVSMLRRDIGFPQ